MPPLSLLSMLMQPQQRPGQGAPFDQPQPQQSPQQRWFDPDLAAVERPQCAAAAAEQSLRGAAEHHRFATRSCTSPQSILLIPPMSSDVQRPTTGI
jgi:hypothetical protein